MAKKRLAKDAQVRRVAAVLAVERDVDRVEAYCRDALGVAKTKVAPLIAEARAVLAMAADVDVREELGRRKEQLEDVRERARNAGDLRVELAAIQELAKLCDLYKTTAVVDAESEAEGAVAQLARSHLEALKLAPNGLPLEELARLVAARYIEAVANNGK